MQAHAPLARAKESSDLQTGSVGRGAEGWPPAGFAGGGSRFEACWPDLLDLNQANQQTLMKVQIEIRESRFAPAHLGHRDVVIAGVLALARMLVVMRIRTVRVSVVSVAVQHLGMQVHAPRATDIAVGIHVHVETAELNGKEAHACGDHDRVLETAHGKIVSLPWGAGRFPFPGGERNSAPWRLSRN